MSWFSFLKKKSDNNSPPMKKTLIVGLGNIGAEYQHTRHNIGFDVLDELSNQEGFAFETQKLGQVAWHKYKGRILIFLKPNTYMNLSGKAVKYWMQQEKISQNNILVITDDLNLDFGTIRMKSKGSDGGHNGLKDIQLKLQTHEYPRLRFGIGASYQKGRQVDYVLSPWSPEEKKALPERIDTCAKMVLSFATVGLQNTMNLFNGK